uniref:Uncharacterized protein n=1 Tax=Culex tarsalis TaxID=7177 RepID=A0A1Q3F3A1_CULTA
MSALAEVFGRVKPLVEAVLRDPQVADIRQLNAQLERIDAGSLQILQSVLLQQLVMAVDNVASDGKNANEVKTALMECVGTILGKGKIRTGVALKTTLVVLLKQMYDAQGNGLVEGLSEEYKLAALRGLSLAAMNAQSELIEEVYTRDQLNLLSQVLFVAVSVLSGGERYRKLRLQAIECVLAVMQVHDGSDFGDCVLRCQVAELLFIVLPKVLVALISVVNGDEKQGKALVRAGVKGLGRVLGLIFEDYDKSLVDEEFSTEEFVKLSKEMGTSGETGRNVLGMGLRDSKARKAYFSNTTRSREWLLEAEKKVHGVLNTISHLRGAEDESVRLEYARMNAELLEKCHPNMPSCSVLFLESILALCQDESAKIRSVCDATLKATTSGHPSITFGTSRKDELLHDALKAIPRSIYRGTETDQIAHFRLLIGYVHFLADAQLQTILANQEILNQLVAVLVAGAELDQPEELVRREYVSYRFRYVPDEGRQLEKERRESRWIVLRNFRGSERSQAVFLEVLRAFQRRPEALATILNYILEDLFTTKLNTNGYLFLLSELIPASCSSPTLTAIFRNVFAEILQAYHWDLDLEETTQIGDLKFNVLHICLSLRLVAKFAQLFRGRDFQLYDTLRHILPLSGSNLNCVNEAAELTLEAVASPDSIQQLISTNLDYISQHISHCLRRPESFPGGVHLLESVLRFVPYESSAVLESTISPIVVSILDGHDQRRTKGILCLRVLQIFVRAIRYRYETELPEQAPDAEQLTKLRERIAQLKQELANKLPTSEATLEEEDPPADDDPPEPMEETPYQSEEDKLPPHIRITLKILTVNFKYLSSPTPEERIVALGTLTEGIALLQPHENQLLPLVHQIWYNFAERFADPHPVVVSAAFDLLVTLAKLARDFIRRRTLDDVLPRLSAFMAEHVDADFSAHQTYKLQRKVLERGAELVRWLRLNERQLDQVLNVARLYRERSGRRELRELAGKMFEEVARYDPGAVWVKVNGKCE